MVAFPLLAAAVAAVFGVATWRAGSKRGPAMRVWSIALTQFAIAAGALAWGIQFGWTPLGYRIFYLFGAVTNVAWLGLGTAWLSLGRRAAIEETVLLTIASAGIAILVFSVGLVDDGRALHGADALPPPSEVMANAIRAWSRGFSIGGSVIVIGGLLWSLRSRRNRGGLALLTLGVVIAGISSELARGGLVEAFSVGLAIGICVMYLGFMRTTTGR